MEDENFNNELESILNKIKQMIENQDFENMPNVDPEQIEQLKMFVSQFDEIKDELKVEIFKLDPFTKQFISSFVGKLDQMDFQVHTNVTPQSTSSEPNVNKELELKDIPGTNENYTSLLTEIDKKLGNKQLSENEINELLDRRAEIAAKMKP